MKTSEAFWMFLPAGLDELFEMVRFERTDTEYNIWLDKKKLSDEDFRNPNIVARGYGEYVTIEDYPMSGRPVFLHMRKNKWWDKSTYIHKRIVYRDYNETPHPFTQLFSNRCGTYSFLFSPALIL